MQIKILEKEWVLTTLEDLVKRGDTFVTSIVPEGYKLDYRNVSIALVKEFVRTCTEVVWINEPNMNHNLGMKFRDGTVRIFNMPEPLEPKPEVVFVPYTRPEREQVKDFPVGNGSYLSTELLRKIIAEAAEYTNASMKDIPIHVNNRFDNDAHTTGVVYSNGAKQPTHYRLSLPSISALTLTDDLLSVAQGIMRTAIHECKHVADLQDNADFDFHNLPYEQRQEEIRAREAAYEAIQDGYFDDNVGTFLELTLELSNVVEQKKENSLLDYERKEL